MLPILMQVIQVVTSIPPSPPPLPVPNKPYGFCGRKAPQKIEAEASELRSCVRVEVAVLGCPSLIALMVSEDVKQH